MLRHKKPLITLFAILVVSLGTSLALRGQNENGFPSVGQEAVIQQRVDPTHYPVTDFDSPESTDPVKRKLQQARNRQHDICDKNIKNADLGKFALKDTDPPVLIQLISSEAPEEPALPIIQSDAVVVGEVTNAQAHLSSDRTNVYSEFLVRVEDVLKNESFGTLSIGGLITTTRPGGRVRFPSGKMLLRGSYGRSMPLIEGRYLFFLKYNEEGQDYSIITAYGLLGGRVLPLDASPKEDENPYANAAEASLLREVKAAIDKGRTP